MDLIQTVVSIIAFAGDSQSASRQAIEFAREGKFDECDEYMQKAKDSALESHKTHTKLLAECAGEEHDVNFLMVHASNHLSVAEMMILTAELFIEVKKEKVGE
ncbi:PTS lactose/cellobiose transporter subunit IIA [Breznakia pachnodae]|uniref:Cellobiose-specific phosphotransferase system component IIA n=1 Tax=Breznakia pachnodae TaxID=265178 RepID=A0ABU0E2E0_9FIRM|nr:PTS lactose/cellobiose transporter subunit IIA [Breznakia pachnodae]MDQ0361057.1 cellobiose-specific phosphotransferase system component IIA [Breznakia pachnodae]